MAKNAKAENAVEFKSIADLTYKHGEHADKDSQFALAAATLIPGFPNDVSKETMSEVRAGYYNRFGFNNPAVRYARTEKDTLIPLKADQAAPEKAELLNIGVDYAMSYSQQAFGALKDTSPNLHGIVKDIRDKANTYASNRFGALKKAYNAMHAAKRERSAIKSWAENCKDRLDALKAARKTALARGDTTVPSELRFNNAVAAFNAELTKE